MTVEQERVNKTVSKYMARIGSKGGKSGKGRDPEQCAKAGRLGGLKKAENRRKALEASARDQPSPGTTPAPEPPPQQSYRRRSGLSR